MVRNNKEYRDWMAVTLHAFYKDVYAACSKLSGDKWKEYIESDSANGCCIACRHSEDYSYVKIKLSNYFWVELDRVYLHYNLCDDALAYLLDGKKPGYVDTDAWIKKITASFLKQYREQIKSAKASHLSHPAPIDEFLEKVLFNRKLKHTRKNANQQKD